MLGYTLTISLAIAALLGATSLAVASGADKSPSPRQGGIPEGYKAAGTPVAEGAEVRLRTATFGAGCFWGVEATFRSTRGVTHTAVGYAGGRTEAPTYKQVCSDTSGHAEVVGVIYDPELVSYEQLLTVFWENHNPTTLNRQGPDVGSQYRSVIFFHDDEQKAVAEKSKEALAASGKWGNRAIVTQIVPAATFYFAEDYHQQYLEKRGVTSCH